MKDFFGTSLSIGDRVAFCAPKYRNLISGTIIAFTPEQVRVEYNNTWNYGPKGFIETYLSYPSNFIKEPTQ